MVLTSAALLVAFYLPFAALAMLAGLAISGVMIGGRSSLAFLVVWVAALLTIWPRLTFGPFAVTPAMSLSLMALMLVLGARIAGGDHRPEPGGQMVRAVLVLAWVFALTYALGMARPLAAPQIENADRSMMILVGSVGITLLTSDAVRDAISLRRLLATLLFAGAIMSAVAVLQFTAGIDLRQSMTLPGFTSAGVRASEEVARFGLNRASGTASHPIELGTTAAIILPIALHFSGFSATTKGRRASLAVAILLILAIGVSVSRSALVALAVVFLVVLPSWTSQRRFRGYLGAAAFVLSASFLVPQLMDGAIGSVTGWRGTGEGGASDVEVRTSRYDAVLDLVTEAPLFGRGYGTFSSEYFFVLDNQYLGLLVEVGFIGTSAFIAVIVISIRRLRAVRRRARSEQERDLARALIASLAAIGLTLATYDGLAFQFTNGLLFFLFGIVAALDRITSRSVADKKPAPADPHLEEPVSRSRGVFDLCDDDQGAVRAVGPRKWQLR